MTSRHPGFRGRSADGTIEVAIAADESLLGAIERQHPHSAMIGCRGGGCGLCRVQLLRGRVSLGRMSRRFVTILAERERFALACRVFPQEDVLFRPAPIAAFPTQDQSRGS